MTRSQGWYPPYRKKKYRAIRKSNVRMKTLLAQYRMLSDAVSRIEHHASCDGHHLSVAFAADSCRGHCGNLMDCAVLQNQPCRYPGCARTSMESAGKTVYTVVIETGWEMYPTGTDIHPANVPHANPGRNYAHRIDCVVPCFRICPSRFCMIKRYMS